MTKECYYIVRGSSRHWFVSELGERKDCAFFTTHEHKAMKILSDKDAQLAYRLMQDEFPNDQIVIESHVHSVTIIQSVKAGEPSDRA